MAPLTRIWVLRAKDPVLHVAVVDKNSRVHPGNDAPCKVLEISAAVGHHAHFVEQAQSGSILGIGTPGCVFCQAHELRIHETLKGNCDYHGRRENRGRSLSSEYDYFHTEGWRCCGDLNTVDVLELASQFASQFMLKRRPPETSSESGTEYENFSV